MSRFVVFYFPYALEMSAQEKIISKLWNMSDLSGDPENGGVFLDPFVIPTLARFSTATHLEPSKIVADIMTKIDLYNGNDQRQKGQGTGVDVSELRREATPYEGLLGVDTRWCIKRLNSLASASLLGERSVTSRDMYAAIKESLRLMDEETAKKYEAFLKPLAEHRRKALARVLLAAMVENFEPQCDSQFNRYIANVLAYNKKQKVAASGGVMKAPDEDYMRKVETFPELGITTSQAKDWRAEVASQYSDALLNSGGKLPGYKSYEPLARAIEASVCSNVKPYAASILAAQQAGNEEDKEKYATVKETLIKRYKFDEHSAEELLKEAEETADFLKDF
jgi:serine protein kinase